MADGICPSGRSKKPAHNDRKGSLVSLDAGGAKCHPVWDQNLEGDPARILRPS